MKDTKRARIIRGLKQLVLSSGNGISRSDAAEKLQIDLRTAAFYLEQLSDSGLLVRETAPVSGKGRPGTIYCSNAGKLCFMGLQIDNMHSCTAVVVDSGGRELVRDALSFPENSSRLRVFNTILELIMRYKNFDNRMLCGVGMAISRWLQPPLAGEDVYANLSDFLERESGVPVHRDIKINALAFALARELDCRDLAVVHAGRVLEFGLVLDGVPNGDFSRREAWLAHLCVNPDGRRCYCGKHGCLENYITSGALNERLQNNPGNATVRALGEMLGTAMVRLARKYPVKAILLIGLDELFPAAETYFSDRVPTGVRLATRTLVPLADCGAALESAYYELYRYTQDV